MKEVVHEMNKAYIFGFLIGLLFCFATVALLLDLGLVETIIGFVIGGLLLLIRR